MAKFGPSKSCFLRDGYGSDRASGRRSTAVVHRADPPPAGIDWLVVTQRCLRVETSSRPGQCGKWWQSAGAPASIQQLQVVDQTRGVPAAAAGLDHLVVVLVDQGRDRKERAGVYAPCALREASLRSPSLFQVTISG